MKTNAERAQERLTLMPKKEFALEKDDFIGALYQSERDEYPGKAVIMFGGSDGIYNFIKLVAEQYVKCGMTVLALAYWNEPGLPGGFEKVPVESRSTVMFQVERKYPEQCWESNMDAFEKTLAFWKEVW